MDDNSIMPFGKFKGEAMANVPDWWLKWFWSTNRKWYNNESLNETNTKIMDYIKDYCDFD